MLYTITIYLIIKIYDILNNKGYGTKKHRDGIAKYGRTKWHRQTFKLKNI